MIYHFSAGELVQFRMYEDDEWVNGYIDEVVEDGKYYRSTFWGTFHKDRVRKRKNAE